MLTASLSLQLIMDVMSYVKCILNSITALNNLIGVIKSNSQQFSRISEKLDKLKKLVESIQNRKQIKYYDDVLSALKTLEDELTKAKTKICNFQNSCCLLKILRSSCYEKEFKEVNESLRDAF